MSDRIPTYLQRSDPHEVYVSSQTSLHLGHGKICYSNRESDEYFAIKNIDVDEDDIDVIEAEVDKMLAMKSKFLVVLKESFLFASVLTLVYGNNPKIYH